MLERGRAAGGGGEERERETDVRDVGPSPPILILTGGNRNILVNGMTPQPMGPP